MHLNEAQQSLLSHWKHIQKKRGNLPARSDFRMQDMGRHARNIVVMEILDNPTDFKYRLIGSSVVDHMHRDYTGETLSSLPGKGPDSKVWRNMDATRQSSEPQYLDVPYVGPHGAGGKTHTLYLPLAANHETPDKIMLVTHYEAKHSL